MLNAKWGIEQKITNTRLIFVALRCGARHRHIARRVRLSVTPGGIKATLMRSAPSGSLTTDSSFFYTNFPSKVPGTCPLLQTRLKWAERAKNGEFRPINRSLRNDRKEARS